VDATRVAQFFDFVITFGSRFSKKNSKSNPVGSKSLFL
jgi:hypothetical protein